MTLQEALNKAVKEFGKDVLIEPRLLNILNDYHGFDEMPASRYILRMMQSDGCVSKIFHAPNLNELQKNRIARRLKNQFGFDGYSVMIIINDLCDVSRSLRECSSNDTMNSRPKNKWEKIDRTIIFSDDEVENITECCVRKENDDSIEESLRLFVTIMLNGQSVSIDENTFDNIGSERGVKLDETSRKRICLNENAFQEINPRRVGYYKLRNKETGEIILRVRIFLKPPQ